MKNKTIFAGLLLLIICSVAFAAAPESLFVSGTNVRIRSNGSTAGKVVATLPFGTWGKILEKSDNKQKLIGKNDYWYKIETPSATGWIFGGLTMPVSEAGRFKTAADLVKPRLQKEEFKLADEIQIYEFLASEKVLATHSAPKAALELAYLQSIDRLCNALSIQGKGFETDHQFIKDNQDLVYLHESAGQHFVKPDSFWLLADKYAEFAEVAEEIAWVAANQQINGETEGDPSMMMAFFELSTGKYIENYPVGKYLPKAYKSGAETIGYVIENLAPGYFSYGEEGEKVKKSLNDYIIKMNVLLESRPEAKEKTLFVSKLDELSARLAAMK